MADVNKSRQLWILVKRLELMADASCPEYLRKVDIVPERDSDNIQCVVRERLGLQDETLLCKLRNHRGSLIPFNVTMASNEKSTPYTLEVVRQHQDGEPRQREALSLKYAGTLKNKLDCLLFRVNVLEACLPDLKRTRHKNLLQDMEELDRKLTFIDHRFHEAEQSQWQGMFRKQPFW